MKFLLFSSSPYKNFYLLVTVKNFRHLFFQNACVLHSSAPYRHFITDVIITLIIYLLIYIWGLTWTTNILHQNHIKSKKTKTKNPLNFSSSFVFSIMYKQQTKIVRVPTLEQTSSKKIFFFFRRVQKRFFFFPWWIG